MKHETRTHIGKDFDDLGWITLKLFPVTDEEKQLFKNIADNHMAMIEEPVMAGQEEDDDQTVAFIGAVVTDPEVLEMEICFPRKRQ